MEIDRMPIETTLGRLTSLEFLLPMLHLCTYGASLESLIPQLSMHARLIAVQRLVMKILALELVAFFSLL